MNILDQLTNSRSTKLPTLPAIGIKILDSVKRDDFSVDDLARTIAVDPALSAKTLSVANSAMYSPPTKVDSIERAVQILGARALKNIALSFVIIRGLKNRAEDEFNHDFFWKRAITSAVTAETISKHLGNKSGDIFLTSLLMDIGIIVMYMAAPEEYMHVMREDKSSDADIIRVEREVFGFDHQEVGKEILKLWNIPEAIHMPVAFHHGIDECPEEFAKCSKVLRISNIVSSLYHGGSTIATLEKLTDILKEEAGFNDTEVKAFIDEVAGKTIEVLNHFNIDPGEMKPYSEILNEANEELSRLNISYGQLVIELRRQKDRAEGMAKELKKANEQLRTLAFQDPLTGLYNHRFFQEEMEREIHRADRYGQFFSLVLFDIDHFKYVNDFHGHIQGDKVIAALGEIMRETMRESDKGARYGGDEFACLLPNTDTKGTYLFAERIRKRAEEFVIESETGPVRFTLSIGVGTYKPDKGLKKKAQIIDMVDKALYVSKNEGRNKVSMIPVIT